MELLPVKRKRTKEKKGDEREEEVEETECKIAKYNVYYLKL